MKYEKPNLEEIELELEGSFLTQNTFGEGTGGGDKPTDKPWD